MRELGATTRGVWARAQALEVVSRAVVRRRVDSGVWQRPWPGVYADAGVALDPEQRAFAAVLASGGGLDPARRTRAAACGRTAARVQGFVLVDDDDPVTGAREHLHDEVLVQQRLRPLVAPDGRVLQRHELVLQERDLVRRPSGLVLTSPVRTVLDCAALLQPEALVCLLDDALHRGLVSREALAERAGGSRAAAALRRGLDLADGRAESPGESLARLLLLPVLPGLVPQVEVFDRASRLVARLDLADEQRHLAVELDGRRGHAGDAMLARDQRRDASTAALGWLTVRGTWWDVRRGQAAFVRRVLAQAARAA